MKRRSDHSLEHLLPAALPRSYPNLMFKRFKGWRWHLGWLWLRIRHRNDPKDAFGRPYPLSHCLSEVGPGWATLVKACYDLVKRQGGTIVQVKEKYGGLCFYADGLDNPGDQLLWEIRSISEKICEECGERGSQNETGWVKTLCDRHRAERDQR